ncbi:MAG: CDP-diacylglycerol--serine O-phosphatidyltransferase, partial [Desulfobacteraceae bacterium]|nr:CDP-diacylglycerol--serine O-phosphatidyltransferase [Desulfobacteraceae bacterium]
AAIDGKFAAAAIAIIIGVVFDILDGKIARATNTTSQFGLEYDSLADLITFGLAPALLMVLWALQPIDRLGWPAGFLFMACGALRLARFNTTTSSSLDHFEGLPIPAAAAMNVSLVLLFTKFAIDPAPFRIFLLIMMYFTSFCMVSSFRYKSFKKISLFKSLTFNKLVRLILIFVAIISQPTVLLSVFFFIYILSGPVLFIVYHASSKEDEETQIDKGF